MVNVWQRLGSPGQVSVRTWSFRGGPVCIYLALHELVSAIYLSSAARRIRRNSSAIFLSICLTTGCMGLALRVVARSCFLMNRAASDRFNYPVYLCAVPVRQRHDVAVSVLFFFRKKMAESWESVELNRSTYFLVWGWSVIVFNIFTTSDTKIDWTHLAII